MRTHKVVYEIMVSPVNSVRVQQFMTQEALSELLSRDGVRLICVNCSSQNRTSRHRPKQQEDPLKRKERQERRLSEYLQKKGR